MKGTKIRIFGNFFFFLLIKYIKLGFDEDKIDNNELVTDEVI